MKQIGSIQILRAVAALMVVLAHAQDDASHEALKAGVSFTRTHLLPWVTGVDLFFVISGFIMVHASARLFATPGGSSAFLARRVIRIVPLYWGVTSITLVLLMLLARPGHDALPSLSEVLTSFGFIPYGRAEDGVPRPVVSLGWTLNYEMFFYVVFAAFLWLRREAAVGGVAAALVLMVALGALWRPGAIALSYWSDPIVLEFALGMGLALAWAHGVRLNRGPAAALMAAALLLLAFDLDGMRDVPAFGVDPNGFGRLLACGLPMAALLGATVLSRPALPSRGHGLAAVALLGDASYALYLFHPLVIIATRKVYLAAGLLPALGVWPLVLAELVLASAAAVAIHLVVEKPVTAALQARFAFKTAPGRSAPGEAPLVSSR